MNGSDIEPVVDWLIGRGLAGTSEQELIEGFCERLDMAGFDLLRGSIGSDLLHPVHTARSFVWRRGEGVRQENHSDLMDISNREEWEKSPFFYMLNNDVRTLRQKLDASLEPDRFPLFQQLRDEGGTEYAATLVQYGETASFGDVRGILCSLTTSRPNGFDKGQIDAAHKLARMFAWAYKTISTVTTGRVLMDTYLGRIAGDRVLRGEIRRGKAEPVRTVLWNSDLRGFTRLADSIRATP